MKTLLEHHYEWRIVALKDDKPYTSILKAIEKMAELLGWRYVCSMETIRIHDHSRKEE